MLPRHVPPCSAQLGMRQVLCHVLLISTRRCHTNTFSTMEYLPVTCAPCAPLTMSSCSRSSSLTITSTSSAPTSPACSSTTTILQDEQPAIKLEKERDESRFESYGGDDPEHPPAKNNSFAPPPPFLPKPNTGPNVVTWDGPDDPENPKNWSFWYRWCITIACTVMTLNVYVPSDQAELLSSYTN